MHIEVQVALNFVISYLYNKLPRRRVNIFGEELEKALKDKFQGHWYPDKPFKGSAFRSVGPEKLSKTIQCIVIVIEIETNRFVLQVPQDRRSHRQGAREGSKGERSSHPGHPGKSSPGVSGVG